MEVLSVCNGSAFGFAMEVLPVCNGSAFGLLWECFRLAVGVLSVHDSWLADSFGAHLNACSFLWMLDTGQNSGRHPSVAAKGMRCGMWCGMPCGMQWGVNG